MYAYLTLPDKTEIVHSEMQPDNTVKVYCERPDEKDGFHNAYCILPSYRWEKINGFSIDEINSLTSLIEKHAHLIIRLSQEGGIDNASGL